jgi:NAD(P)-dependent dehydrogenase (short-subunit alcohol dehydrogenase family)
MTTPPGQPTGRLQGKTALVTGASGNIGRTTALALAREGAAVAVSGLEPDLTEATAAQLRALGARVLARPARLHLRSETRALLRDVLTFFDGRLDILVSNAGMSQPQPLAAVTDESYDYQVEVNFGAHFWLSQGAAAAMKPQRSGSLIYISSTGAIAAHVDTVVYDAMKAGLEALARGLAVELGPYGIRVNAVQPGNVVPSERLAAATPDDRAHWQTIPLGRPGLPDDIAASVVFLASDEASYITGSVLRVDGGRTARTPVVVSPAR